MVEITNLFAVSYFMKALFVAGVQSIKIIKN